VSGPARWGREAWSVLKQTIGEYQTDNVPRLAAALSYYTAFALAPVLVIVIAVAGLAFDSGAVRVAILEQVAGLLGSGGAALVGQMLEAAGRPGQGVTAVVVGLATMVLAASGLFAELQDALDIVWDVEPRTEGGFLGVLRRRFVSFTMVVGLGFLLLVSLVVSAAVAAFSKFAGGRLPGWEIALQGGNVLLGFAFTTVVFALVYKVLPDVKLTWRDVWTEALITAALFSAGRLLIGLYLGRSTVASAYGAAGSLAIVLLWVYYSSQILLLGAELTQVRMRRRGERAQPKPETAALPRADAT
jgi:membrane protein